MLTFLITELGDIRTGKQEHCTQILLIQSDTKGLR